MSATANKELVRPIDAMGATNGVARLEPICTPDILPDLPSWRDCDLAPAGGCPQVPNSQVRTRLGDVPDAEQTTDS